MNKSSSWQEIADEVAPEIAALPAGARVPSHRQLVDRFGASASTVAAALASLVQRGLIESRPGAGSFRTKHRERPPRVDTTWQVAALALTPSLGPDATPHRDLDADALGATLAGVDASVIDLNGGYLHPELQPQEALARALARTGRQSAAWARPDSAGLPELRDWFASAIGAGLTRNDLLITGGGQSALATALRGLGQPGDPVIVESPTFAGTIAAVRAAGLRVVSVPVDAQGVRTADVERALVTTGARIVVVQPLFHNPTGASLSAERAAELLDLAERHGAFVVEDDFARDLAHADAGTLPQPLVARDRRGGVVHIRSLTKPTSPNLRIAALAARGPVLTRLRAAHLVDTMFIPAPLQLTALDLVASPAWTRLRRTLAAALQHRREVMVDAVARLLPDHELALVPRGGYHLWLQLPSGLEPRAAASRALVRGVAITPGDNYYATPSNARHVRLSYVAAPSAADLEVAVARLAD